MIGTGSRPAVDEVDNDEDVEMRRPRVDGMPESPPPTYSVIERQTSFSSYISQTSSQCTLFSTFYTAPMELYDVMLLAIVYVHT